MRRVVSCTQPWTCAAWLVSWSLFVKRCTTWATWLGNHQLQCGHRFHETCIHSMRVFSCSALCPLCRSPSDHSDNDARHHWTHGISKNGAEDAARALQKCESSHYGLVWAFLMRSVTLSLSTSASSDLPSDLRLQRPLPPAPSSLSQHFCKLHLPSAEDVMDDPKDEDKDDGMVLLENDHGTSNEYAELKKSLRICRA